MAITTPIRIRKVPQPKVRIRVLPKIIPADGEAATVEVGEVTTLPAGSDATVVNSGTESAAVLDFGIPQGANGTNGTNGNDGADGAVWFTGAADPSSGTGQDGDFYLQTGTGATGVVGDVWEKASGTWSIVGNIRGEAGSGSGDMLAATYDPQNIADDAFDRANHTGTQLAATISDFSTAADLRIAAAVGVTVQAWHTNLDDWSNVNPVGYYTAAQINAGFQPLDADLTALAAAGNSGVLAATTASFTTADETKLDGIEAGADVTPSGAPIFLVATGQSNMAAKPAYAWTPASNLFLWNNTDIDDTDPVGTAFIAMPNDEMNVAYAWANEFAKANPLSNVYLVVAAENGMAIAKWMTGDPDPDMYAYTKNAVEAALTEVSLTEINGLIWWQGETDVAALSTTYYSDFNTVMARFATETWWPETTPITIMGTCEGGGGTLAEFNHELARLAADEPGIRTYVRTFLVGTWTDNVHMDGGADYQQAGILAYRSQTMQQNAYANPFTGDFTSRRDYDGTHRLTVRNSNSGSSASARAEVQNASGTFTIEAMAGAFAGFANMAWTGGTILIQNSFGFVFTLGAQMLSWVPFGYASLVGVGGTVTQATSKSTSVTLDKATGKITMHNATLNAGTIVSFTFTNSHIATNDMLIINIDGGAANAAAYTVQASCGAGSATISVRNNTAGNLGEAIVLQYALFKGAID